MIHFIRETSRFACETFPCDKCGYRLGSTDMRTDWIGRVSPDCPQCAGRVHARPVLMAMPPIFHPIVPCRDCGALYERDHHSRRLCDACRELRNRPKMRFYYAKHKAKKLERLKREMEREFMDRFLGGAA